MTALAVALSFVVLLLFWRRRLWHPTVLGAEASMLVALALTQVLPMLVTGAVDCAMMHAAERYGEFIAGLAAERARLQVAQVMRVGGLRPQMRHGCLATERRCSRLR